MPWIYRAEGDAQTDRSPKKLAQLGAMTTYVRKSLLRVRQEVSAAIKKDGAVSYCKDHRNNRFNFALSCAIDQGCDGYASVRNFTYAMNFKGMRIWDITANKQLLQFPGWIDEDQVLMCLDVCDQQTQKNTDWQLALWGASIIGLGIPNSREIVILMDVPLKFITHYRDLTKSQDKDKWILLDWAKIKAESALPSTGGRKAFFEKMAKAAGKK